LKGLLRQRKSTRRKGSRSLSFTRELLHAAFVSFYLHGYLTDELDSSRDRILQKTGVKVFSLVRRVGQKKTLDEMLNDKWEEVLKISNENGRENIKEYLEPATEERSPHKTSYIIYSPELSSLETSDFVDAWVNLCDELASEICQQ
jgi:hypothetical protein